MTYQEFVENITRFYGIQKLNNEMYPPNVMETLEWIDHNIKNYQGFYNKIKETFQPTFFSQFPSIPFLQKMNQLPELVEYRNDEMFSPENCELFLGHNIVHGAEYQQIIADDKIMSAKELIKKYGVQQCGAAWRKEIYDMTEQEREKMNKKLNEKIKNK